MFDFYDYDKNDTIEGQELAQVILDGKYPLGFESKTVINLN